jgi:hypothetical protein
MTDQHDKQDGSPALAGATGSATDCRCDEYRAALKRIALFYRGGERATDAMLEMRDIARRALTSPNDQAQPRGKEE